MWWRARVVARRVLRSFFAQFGVVSARFARSGRTYRQSTREDRFGGHVFWIYLQAAHMKRIKCCAGAAAAYPSTLSSGNVPADPWRRGRRWLQTESRHPQAGRVGPVSGRAVREIKNDKKTALADLWVLRGSVVSDAVLQRASCIFVCYLGPQGVHAVVQ